MAAEPVAAPPLPDGLAEHIHGLVDARMAGIMRALRYQNEFKELMKPDIQIIHTRLDDLRNSNTQNNDNKNKFNERRAEKVTPPEYHGKADKNTTFEQWSDLFRNWAAALHMAQGCWT